jgi:hypothetical protein
MEAAYTDSSKYSVLQQDTSEQTYEELKFIV